MMQKALFVLLLVLSACTGEEKATIPDEPETPEAKITLAEGTDTNPLLDASGGTVTVHFTATADWTATIGNVRATGWITVSPVSGNRERHQLVFRWQPTKVRMNAALPFSWSVETIGKRLSFHKSRKMH